MDPLRPAASGNGAPLLTLEEQNALMWDALHNVFHCLDWTPRNFAERVGGKQARLERVRGVAATALVAIDRGGGRKVPH